MIKFRKNVYLVSFTYFCNKKYLGNKMDVQKKNLFQPLKSS